MEANSHGDWDSLLRWTLYATFLLFQTMLSANVLLNKTTRTEDDFSLGNRELKEKLTANRLFRHLCHYCKGLT